MPDVLSAARSYVDAALCMLIWLVQVVVYPAFRVVEEARFTNWHRAYMRTISIIVIPLMVAQAGLVLHQLLSRPNLQDALTMVAILCAWIATFAFSVPCHNQLQANGTDAPTISRLIRTNWIRTAAWTAVLILGLAK